jgi:hypothetical protein
VLLIDAANVVGSRSTGWWRDRPRAARELTTRVRQAAAAGTLVPPVVLVLEGQAWHGVDEGPADGVEVVHASGSGDDTLATLAAAAASDQPVVLVSGDRGLAERARRMGAEIVGPTWLLDQLPPFLAR